MIGGVAETPGFDNCLVLYIIIIQVQKECQRGPLTRVQDVRQCPAVIKYLLGMPTAE